MPVSIDQLQIEVEAQAQKANSSIGNLIEKLDSLSSSLGKINSAPIAGLGNSVQKLGLGMQSLKGVGDKKFENLANSINKLSAVDTAKLNSTASAIRAFSKSIGSIGEMSKGTQQLGELSKGIAQLGYKSFTKAIDNIPKLASAMKELMATLSTAPKVSRNLIDMTNALGRLARTGASSGRAANSLAKSLDTYTTSTGRASRGTVSLASAIGKLYATYWLLFRAFGKIGQAINISSDLTEVQNVVDVTFGNMVYKVEDFAKTSIEQFGMSELALKQYASRFQAMGSAMGIDKSLISSANRYLNEQTQGYIGLSNSMSDVSLNLTKLTADMASFYNMEQSAVAEDLESVFTGQTRPLRTYGLDLTEATLKEWAMKNGLDASIDSMSQAEKTMLRYQYVLTNTGAAQGDFARTADTWANQVRILKQNFEQLAAVVGGVFINALKPLVQALNAVMQKLIAFAKVVSDSLGKIFGWTYEEGSGGFANDFASAEDSAGGIEDSLGGAAKAAKKMRSYLLGIDELNVIEPADDSNSGSSSGSGLGNLGSGGAGGDGGGWKKTDSIFKAYESGLDTLYKLGEYIGKAITDVLNNINWEKVYEGARNFGKGLADFLNGLISPELFGAVGRTIAGSLNTAIYAALSFAENFDFKNLGLSIAEGINEFFNTFDFSSLAKMLNTWAEGILDTAIVALSKIKWYKIGEKIGGFLADINFLKIGKKIGKAIWKAINSGLELFEGMFEKAPVETAILSIVGLTKLLKNENIVNFVKKITEAVDGIKLFGTALGGSTESLQSLQADAPRTAAVIGTLTRAFANFRFGIENGNFLTGISEGFLAIKNSMTGVQKATVGIVAGFAEFFLVKDAVRDIAVGAGSLTANIAQLGIAVGAAGVAFSMVFGFPAGLIATGIVGAIGALVGLKSAFDEIDAEKIGVSIKNALTVPGGVPLDTVVDSVKNSIASVGEGFAFLSEQSAGLDVASGNIKNVWLEIEKIETAMEAGVISVEEGTGRLKEQFSLLEEATNEKFNAITNTLLAAYGENGALSGAVERLGENASRVVGEHLGLNERASQRLGEITAEIASLDPTNPRYAELREEMARLSLETDAMAEAIQRGAYDINSVEIDYSKLVPSDDGSLDTGYFNGVMNDITQAVLDAQGGINEGAEGVRKALQEDLTRALNLGETGEIFKEQLDILPEAVSILNTDMATEAQGLTDAIQIHLVEGVSTIISDATASWEEMKWHEKLMSGFSSADEYAQNAAQEYKLNYIDPVSSSIEEQFSQLGIDGAGWASQATEEIISSLFSVQDVWDGSITTTITTLNGNYKQIIEGATDGIAELAQTRGKDTIEGFNTGILDNSTTSTDPVNTWMNGVNAAIHDSVLEFGSPSRKTWNYAKDTIDGFNNGILENMQTSQGIIGQWMETINSAFSATGDKSMFSGMFTALKSTWSELSTWWKAEFRRWFNDDVKSGFAKEKWEVTYSTIRTAMKNTWEETVSWWRASIYRWYNNDVKTWFTKEKWIAMYNTIKISLQTVWNETTIWWRQAIQSWYNNDIKVWFTKDKWTFPGIEEGLSASFKGATEAAKQVWNSFAREINSKMKMTIDPIVVDGQQVVSGQEIILGQFPTFASGGFPDVGDIFIANEMGPELVGTIGGRPAVASGNEITGIRDAVYDSGETQSQLLSTAIELLQIIANKDFDVQLDGRSLVEAYDARKSRNGYSFN